uniref:DUF7587 domain-containing protein n=1 Tax=Mycena chlorophos TaxID=658473 RepID=A0ABQ0L894_MYCCL|nr:predicted protein [Mycena chlorophos]
MDSSILPPGRLQSGHTYAKVTSHRANSYIFRVHRQSGRGRLIPGVGFVATAYDSAPETAKRNIHSQESAKELAAAASEHITQWVDGTHPSLRSKFVSGSFSLPYTLFEARRWNHVFHCDTTLISVIDPMKIPGDAWLGAQLVGVHGSNKDARFARWAQEVLVYGHIPYDAVVFTAPLDTYCYSLLPPWCNPVIDLVISRTLKSTEAVVDAFCDLARRCTPEDERKLVDHVVAQSVKELQEGRFNDHNASADEVAWLAAFFAWWPRRMRGVHPQEFLDLKFAVRKKVGETLRGPGKQVASGISDGSQEEHGNSGCSCVTM